MSAIGISSHLFWQALASSSSVHAENVSPMIVVVGYAGNPVEACELKKSCWVQAIIFTYEGTQGFQHSNS